MTTPRERQRGLSCATTDLEDGVSGRQIRESDHVVHKRLGVSGSNGVVVQGCLIERLPEIPIGG